jgi:hypothetical protein
MVNDVLGWLDYSAFAEAALVLFLLVFAGVSFAMMKMTREWSGRCAAIPLSDCESNCDAMTVCEAMAHVEQTR